MGVLDEAWGALAGPDGPGPPAVEVLGGGGLGRSRFGVDEIATACVATALGAAVALGPTVPSEPIALDLQHVADACRSERRFSVDGVPGGGGFAPLSRFWPVVDGWVRTHANYPWHRGALLDALGLSPDEPDIDAVGAAIASLTGPEFEARVFAAGGVGAMVRSFDDWARHPQGRALAAEGLVTCETLGEAAPRHPSGRLRVLDLTRVIAGPVCTRVLGALGADVLRIDGPHRRDLAPGSFADTLLAKRSATVDLATAEGLERVHALVGEADVVVQGYRPGALARFGLSAEDIAERHPGTVVVVIDAWGHSGPWAGRRGFDSVVQAASGLAAGESADGRVPGTLPCQLLDHGTGYLAAAAALDGVRRQRHRGGTLLRRLSLARTAWWVATAAAPAGSASAPSEVTDRYLVEVPAGGHTLTAVAPPGAIGGRPLRWPRAGRFGADEAAWEEPGTQPGPTPQA